MTLVRSSLTALLALALTACATTDRQRGASEGQGAIEQPFRDLSIIRDKTPEALAASAEAPYAAGDARDCPALAAEIARLDAVLGPDLDVVRPKAGWVGADAIYSALRGALDLPFRGIIRRVTGAERHDREQARAVLAGMVRRGFLKGLARAADCPPAPAAPPAP